MAAAFNDGEAVRLDIHRKDMSEGMGWDELMDIKRACGFGGKDAVEFYPSDAEILNTGNIRHLYIFDYPLPLIRRNHGGRT